MLVDEGFSARVQRVLGASAPVSWKADERGYTPAERWTVRFEDGSSAFVKAAVNEMTAGWLRQEFFIYDRVEGKFFPHMLAWEDGERPILVLEDLSQAVWPPPWSPSYVDRVVELLSDVRTTEPPDGLPLLNRSSLPGWSIVAEDPTSFLGLGLCSPEWLEEALSALVTAELEAPLEGEEFVHLDVRSDNLCFDGGRTLLVDWNHACRGNGLSDVAAWLPSLQAEGGPAPEEVSTEASVFAGIVSGYFAARAGKPIISNAPRVRGVQLAQLRTALPWAVRALDLPPIR